MGWLTVPKKSGIREIQRKKKDFHQPKSVSILALRTKITGNLTVAELLDRVAKTVAEAQASRDYQIFRAAFEQLGEMHEGENIEVSSPRLAQMARVMLVECDRPETQATKTLSEAIASVEKKGDNWIIVLYDSTTAGNLTIECQYNGGLFDMAAPRYAIGNDRTHVGASPDGA
ncbi:MAG: hypothetical protein GDA38_27875 [Hormoscilla sp. SP12CHS1]|nr:hypothetical protein [Hormoscilla sp. SP12CHS1]